MEITVKRDFNANTYTIGRMSIDGVYFCDTLEDKVRDLQTEVIVRGLTAIPAGRYNVILRKSPKFNRELPRLEGVPDFEGILIHRGNTAKDTSGCILVGENTEIGKVLNSTPYEKALVILCKIAIARGEEITIEVINVKEADQ
jgi:hypothetical protein